MDKINKVEPLKHSYIHYDMDYGTVNCYGEGPVRDMFQKGMDVGNLPPDVYHAFEDLLLRIYQETGEMSVINVQGK